MLDPETNIRYAAEYLRLLYSRHKTWNEAISRYHSSVPKRKVRYLRKVKSYWSDLRQHKIKIPINIKLDVLSKRDKKIQYFKEEFRRQKLLDNI